MFNPRVAGDSEHRIDWSSDAQSSQAIEMVRLALEIEIKLDAVGANIVERAIVRLPDVHVLFRRALSMIQTTPLDEEVVPEETFYTYAELCSGQAGGISLGRLFWKPLATDGSSFRKLLRAYAEQDVQRDMRYEWEAFVDNLQTITVNFNDDSQDQRGWLIYCISNDGISGPHLKHNEACLLVNSACRGIPKNGERTREWAEKMISEGVQKIAEERYRQWMLESKEGGVPAAFVKRLAAFRAKRDAVKGKRSK